MAFSAFHVPTWLYTWVHTVVAKFNGVPVASEVVRGWWIGGRYASELNRKWACTIDLTNEFPESCRNKTFAYMLIPCWDGTPPAPRDIERAARFAADHVERGDVMVHCAHGRGRSTCVMVRTSLAHTHSASMLQVGRHSSMHTPWARAHVCVCVHMQVSARTCTRACTCCALSSGGRLLTRPWRPLRSHALCVLESFPRGERLSRPSD